LDHVVSQTGLIFPIATLVDELRQRGVETLIDGAHAPGMVPLNLLQLGATFYTGNAHKWLCAPKGAAFLYVQRDRQSAIHPLTISHGANDPRTERSRFHLEFDWMGTDDPTAYLCVPEAIRFMAGLLPGGWPEVMERNHQLAIAARQILCHTLEVSPPCPEDLLGALAVIPLPDGDATLLHNHLLQQYHIEVPIVPWRHQGRLLRISAQLYNQIEQYRYLAEALLKSLQENR
jgi:isopenicillin-N epimerase